MSHPLAGLRVLELATEIAGPYAGKLLADAGADVVKIEHPDGGDPLRRWAACGAAIPPGEDGALFRFLNTSKRSIAIDLATCEGHAEVVRLAATADIVIESIAPEAGLEWGAVSAAGPATSLVSISWFGRSGPWRDRAATEFTLQAWSGSTVSRGTTERPPVAAGGRLGEWLAGGYAAIGAIAAAMGARHCGRGQHVDLSILEVVHLSMSPFSTVVASFGGPGGTMGRTVEIPSVEPASDGYVGFCTITNQQWRDFLVLIEQGKLVDDADLANYFKRNERRHEVYAMIHAWTEQHSIAEVVERASLLRIPVAPIANGETVTEVEHFRERGSFVPLPGSPWMRPRVPYRLTRGRLPECLAAPRLGEHGGGGGAGPVEMPWRDGPGGARVRASGAAEKLPNAERDPEAVSLPLAGLRVVDFTMFWAGPFVGHFLAALGADVIKLESIQRPDGIRFASTSRPTAESFWEWSGMLHGINAGKRGITLDLSRPRGRELAEALLARADAAVENFSPRVLDNLGLRYETLARTNPGLILVRMPAFGLDGPWRDRTGFAQTMEQVSGMAWVTGFADGPPVIPRGPCDPLAGVHAVLALLVALEHRNKTGEGQLVESVMVEAALNAAAEQMLEWQAYGSLLTRDGNRSPLAAPQNLYACRGEERWLALAVETDAQWRALVEVLGAPDWASDPALDTRAGRRAHRERIDAELERFFVTYDRDEIAELLLARGIPAAPALHSRESAVNPQMRARAFFEPENHPITGTHELPGLPMRFSGVSRFYRSPSPTLGQHTREVLSEILGLGEEEIEELRAEGIIGERPVGV